MSSILSSFQSSNVNVSTTPSENAELPEAAQDIVRSTPVKGHQSQPIGTSFSLDLSSIHGSCRNQRHTSTSTTTSSRSVNCGASGSSSLSSVYQHEYDDDLPLPASKRKKKVNQKGHEWQIFKPVRPKSIYGNLVLGTLETAIIAEKWVILYKRNKCDALIDIIQCLFDISGYQEHNISEIFNVEEHATQSTFKQLVLHLQNKCSRELLVTGKYLLKSKVKWALPVQDRVYEFCKYLVLVSHSNGILYEEEDFLMKYLVVIMTTLALSSYRNLSHMGIALMVKFTTAFMEIDAEFDNEINELLQRSNTGDGVIAELQSKHIKCMKLLSVFEQIVIQNCGILDDDLGDMKATSIQEMWVWFQLKPSLISETGNYFTKLMEAITDINVHVRLAAISVCHNLLDTNKINVEIQSVAGIILQKVMKRLTDVDADVTIAAIRLFKSVSNNCVIRISDHQERKIYLGVYNTINLKIAALSGEFLIDKVRRQCSTDPASVLRELVFFIESEDTSDKVVLLVEAILHYCPELQNWNEIILYLSNNDLTENQTQILIDIVVCSAIQTILGKTTNGRTKSFKVTPQRQAALKASAAFLISMKSMLQMYSDPKIVRRLLEILLVINYSDDSLKKCTAEINELHRRLLGVFARSSDVPLMRIICQILAQLYKEENGFKSCVGNHIDLIYKTIADITVERLDNVRENESPTPTELSELELFLTRLSLISEYYNMSTLLNSEVIFSDSVQLVGKINEYSIKCLLTCASWLVIWQFREIYENEALPSKKQKIQKLKEDQNTILAICFKFLEEPSSTEIQREAFLSICNIYVKIAGSLRDVNHSLNPPLLQEQQSKHLVECAERFIFKKPYGSDMKWRQTSLAMILNMHSLTIIPNTNIMSIFSNYHMCYDYFGRTMDNFLNNLLEANLRFLANFIVQVVKLRYEFITQKTQTISSRTRIANIEGLKNLTKQFNVFIGRKKLVGKLITEIGIHQAANNGSLALLEFIKYFTDLLLKPDKLEIMQYLKSTVPKEQCRNRSVLSFISYVQTNLK